MSGDAFIAASVTATPPAPGASRVSFYLDSDELLTDYSAPFEFVLPTDTFGDGAVLLEVEARLGDGTVTGRTAVTLNFDNANATEPSPPTGFVPRLGTTPEAGQPYRVLAVGDGGGVGSDADELVARMQTLSPNQVLYLGDVYRRGKYTEFVNAYGLDTRWGSFYDITNPTIGNHELGSDGTWGGYDRYWHTPDPDYSYDAAGWHFISLNVPDRQGLTTEQQTWLDADLAANTADCVVVFLHHPVLSIGKHGNADAFAPAWATLVDAGVDVVLTAHDHHYQRWAPLDRALAEDSAGATQFVVGTGGHSVRPFVSTDSRLEVGFDQKPEAVGVLQLDLSVDSAEFAYITATGSVLDSGTIDCGVDTTPPNGTVVTPVGRQTLTSQPVEFTGMATDDVAVGDVGVAIRNQNAASSSFRRWLQPDMASWGRYNLLPVEVASPGAAETPWSFAVSLPDGKYGMQLTVRDAAGNRDPSRPWRNFRVDVLTEPTDTTIPVATVETPAPHATISGPTVNFTGEAFDNVGVGTVEIVVRNRVTREYLRSDGTFAAGWNPVPVTLANPGAATTDWTASYDLAPGNYWIKVRAFDTSGNRNDVPRKANFSVS